MIGSTNNVNPSTEVLTEEVGNPTTQVITENIESTHNNKPTTEVIANPTDSVITEESIPSTDNGNQVTAATVGGNTNGNTGDNGGNTNYITNGFTGDNGGGGVGGASGPSKYKATISNFNFYK